MVKRFGVSGLDEVFGNGFEDDFSIGLLGAHGTNRDVFNYSFTEEGILNEEPIVYFCSNEKTASLLRELDKRGANKSDFLEVIDGYSLRLRESQSNVDFVLESSNLNEFLDLYNSAREKIGDNGRFVIDSFSNLVDFADLYTMNNLLKILLAEEKDRNNSVLISLSPYYREEIVNLVGSFVDGFVELIRVKGENFLKVHWLSDFDVNNSWFRYEVIEGLSKDSPLNIELKGEVSEKKEDDLLKSSYLLG